MAFERLVWDQTGDRFYETGVKNCVLYVQDSDGSYPKGTAWNGITGITESPSGAEANPLYADDTKYLNLISNEDFGATIEAYTYPEEFGACNGEKTLAAGLNGVTVGQQARRPFGLCYRTTVGNDTVGNDLGYKLHLVYGATAAPSERAYATINDSPEAITFSWEVSTIPVDAGANLRPTSILTIDSTKLTSAQKEKLEVLMDHLYGKAPSEGDTTGIQAHLPLPTEVAQIFAGTYTYVAPTAG